MVRIRIDNGQGQILIGCIYRPPLGTDHLKNIKIDNEIIKSLYYAKKSNKKNVFNGLVVVGDFNFPYIEWSEEGVTNMTGPTDSPGDKLISLLDNEFITQNFWKPTLWQANGTCKNVLDYILTDKPERISNISIGEPLGSARQVHLSITFNLTVDSIP